MPQPVEERSAPGAMLTPFGSAAAESASGLGCNSSPEQPASISTRVGNRQRVLWHISSMVLAAAALINSLRTLARR